MTYTWCGLDFVVWLMPSQAPSFLTAASAMLKTPQFLEFQASAGPFRESCSSKSKSQYVYLMPFLFCIAMRIIRILMAFLLYFFYFLNELFQAKGTDPREAVHGASAVTTDQKKNRENQPVLSPGRPEEGSPVSGKFTKTWKWAKSSTWRPFNGFLGINQ